MLQKVRFQHHCKRRAWIEVRNSTVLSEFCNIHTHLSRQSQKQSPTRKTMAYSEQSSGTVCYGKRKHRKQTTRCSRDTLIADITGRLHSGKLESHKWKLRITTTGNETSANLQSPQCRDVEVGARPCHAQNCQIARPTAAYECNTLVLYKMGDRNRV